MSYDALFSPIKLRGLELKNRVVLPGMNTKMVKDKNDVGEDLPAYHAARAAGGCGLNIVELVSICPECHAYLYLGLYNEHHRDQLRKITDAIHAAGGKAGVQIWHGGFVPEEFFDKTNKLETPDTLTVERNHEMRAQYWGGYIRHNELYRQTFDLQGKLLAETPVAVNDAVMMYSPYLEESKKEG